MTGPLNDHPTTRRSRGPAVVAFVAGAAGLALLVLGVVRLVGSTDEGTAVTTTVGFVTTTTTEAPATTDPPTTEAPATTEGTGTTPSTGDLMTVTDETGALSVSVPAEWDDVSGLAWSVDGEVVGLSIGAATDRDAWYEGWGTPGVFVGVTTVGPDMYTPELGEFGGACSFGDVDNREFEGFTVIVQQWVDCADEGSEFHVAMAWPDSFAYIALIQVVTLDGSGSDLIDTFLTTLSYTP